MRVRVSTGAAVFAGKNDCSSCLCKPSSRCWSYTSSWNRRHQSAAVTTRQKAARKRAAESRQERLGPAIAQLPELKKKQAEAAQRAGKGKCGTRSEPSSRG